MNLTQLVNRLQKRNDEHNSHHEESVSWKTEYATCHCDIICSILISNRCIITNENFKTVTGMVQMWKKLW